MADVITTKKQLKVVAGFSDEDDRTITIDDPKTGLTWSDIENIENAAAGVLIGDKFGASFSRIKEAYYQNQTTTEIDI